MSSGAEYKWVRKVATKVIEVYTTNTFNLPKPLKPMLDTSNSNNILNPEIIAARGEKVYQEQLKDVLEKDHKGEFVAIEVESAKYFLGKSPEEALEKAKKEFPEKIFHLIRIGYAGVYKVSWSAGSKSYGWVF